MIAPHEMPQAGVPATLAAGYTAQLPVLDTERLTLRAPQIADFAAYAEIATGPSGHFLLDAPDREAAWYDFTQMTAMWLLRGFGLWSVDAKADSALVGFVLLGFEPGDHEPELGYMLCASAQGQGFAQEAALAARAYAFDVLKLDTIVSTIDPENAASIRIAEGLGAVRDAAAEAAHDHKIYVYRHPKQETVQ